MQLKTGRWSLAVPRAKVGASGLGVAEGVLVIAVAAAAVALFWALTRPLGPVGRWQVAQGVPVVSDLTLLTRFDPFFRADVNPGGAAAVTSLALKLFGIRIDRAMGRGSAIVATPDGIQGSYAVGDEIVPGVTLKSVAFDHIVLARGGVDEQLFLDQSVAAPVAGVPGAPVVAPSTSGAAAAPGAAQLSPQSLAEGISFAPRPDKGGLIVAPKGTGGLFAQTGLVQGDVVTQINGQPVRSPEDIANAVVRVAPGGRLNFMIERNGTTMNVSAGVPQ